MPRQKPSHKHPRSICQDKNLITSTRGLLPRQKPYHKHPWSLPRGFCQDKNFTTSTRGAFTTAFVKTKTLPQARVEASLRHLRQIPYHKHPRSLHHSFRQDKNLTTSTRGGFTTAFTKTKTLPQAPAEPSPPHLLRQKSYHKCPRSRHYGLLPRQKPYHKHPPSLPHGFRQDKNLTTSTRGTFTTAFAKMKTFPQAPAEPSPRQLPRQKPYHKHPRSLHHGFCQDKNLTTSTRGAFTTAVAQTTTHRKHPRSLHRSIFP